MTYKVKLSVPSATYNEGHPASNKTLFYNIWLPLSQYKSLSVSLFASPPTSRSSASAPVSAARPSTHISSSAAAANSSSRSSSAYRPPSPSPRAPSSSPVPSPGRGGGAGGSGGAGSAGSPLRPLGGVSGCRVTGTGLARRPAMRVICSRGSVQPQNVECELIKAEYQASSLWSKLWLGGLHDMF